MRSAARRRGLLNRTSSRTVALLAVGIVSFSAAVAGCGDDSRSQSQEPSERQWVKTFCKSARVFNDALAPADDDGAMVLQILPAATREALDVLQEVEPPAAAVPVQTFVLELYGAAVRQDTSSMEASTKAEALAAYFSEPNTQVSYPSLDPEVVDRLNAIADEVECGVPAPFGAS